MTSQATLDHLLLRSVPGTGYSTGALLANIRSSQVQQTKHFLRDGKSIQFDFVVFKVKLCKNNLKAYNGKLAWNMVRAMNAGLKLR